MYNTTTKFSGHGPSNSGVTGVRWIPPSPGVTDFKNPGLIRVKYGHGSRSFLLRNSRYVYTNSNITWYAKQVWLAVGFDGSVSAHQLQPRWGLVFAAA